MDFEDNISLIQALSQGKEEAYNYLLSKYHRRLYAYALTLINDHALAEDIVQNVFISVWKFRKRLNPQYSIKSFLFKSVYNEFLNAYKKNKSVTLLEQKYIASISEFAETLDEQKENQIIKVVRREIEKLPPKCRKIFTMSKKEGLTNQEIADYLQISSKTVESHVTNAFKILREELGEKYYILLFLTYFNRIA